MVKLDPGAVSHWGGFSPRLKIQIFRRRGHCPSSYLDRAVRHLRNHTCFFSNNYLNYIKKGFKTGGVEHIPLVSPRCLDAVVTGGCFCAETFTCQLYYLEIMTGSDPDQLDF